MGATSTQRHFWTYCRLRDRGYSHTKAVKCFPKRLREKADRMKKYYG